MGIPGPTRRQGLSNELSGVVYGSSQSAFSAVGTGVILSSRCLTASPAIYVTSPNGFEYFPVGSLRNITWNTCGTVGNVKIEYSVNGGTNWTVITASTENDGCLEWTVANAPSSDCLVRITDAAGTPGLWDVSDGSFSIYNSQPPTITLISPNGGESLTAGSPYSITWSSSGALGQVAIDYSLNGGLTWITIISATPNSGSYTWTVPKVPTVNGMVRVRNSRPGQGPADISDASFSISDVSLPSITVNAPNGGEQLNAGNTYVIAWSSEGAVGNVKIQYSTDTGVSWTTISASTANDGEYQWVVPNSGSFNCLVRISEIDGDPIDNSDGIFTITAKPTVTLTAPNGGETLTVGSVYNITWSSTGPLGSVALDYSIDNGVQWILIVTETPNTGFYDWMVPVVSNPPVGSCLVRIRNSRSGEGPFDVSDAVFTIQDNLSLQLIWPNGKEIIEPGKHFTIRWLTDTRFDIENVRLEYSPDNGTTYLPIADCVSNTGAYEWAVPYHVSPHCLVRISSAADNEKEQDFNLMYDLKFRVDGLSASAGNDFTILFGNEKNELIKNVIPALTFFHESDGKEYLAFDNNQVELGDYEGFLDAMHTLKIVIDNLNEKVSILLDAKLVLENISLSRIYRFKPVVSFSVGEGVEVSIDDFSVKMKESDNGWNVLFNEDFDRFFDKDQLKESGWFQSMNTIKEKTAESADEIDNVSIVKESSNAGQSLMLRSDGEHEAVMVKSFHIPMSFPFDVSDKPFEIRYNNDMYNSISPISNENNKAEAYNYTDDTGYKAHGPYLTPFTTGQIQAITVNYIDTYYIYSFDGKLLSEYDQNGACVRDYIYAGNRLIAEFRPATSKYYYYMSDQINSTRIVTDDSGNVIYSEAYGPYGDVQKTWNKTYDLKQKFSGKEREGYSELDYFGARYYNNNSYRFISVDPILNKEEALANPQLWNLYAYCANNPITHFDPDGRRIIVDDSIKQQFLSVKTYLKKSSLATNTINKLNNSKIADIKIMAWDGGAYFSGSTLTIYWNPNEGNLIGPGQVQSPALILAHECLHAIRKLEDPQGQLLDKSIEMEGFDDMEEFRVIVLERSIVKQINKKLKNGPFESMRDSHNVVGIQVASPTSKEEMK